MKYFILWLLSVLVVMLGISLLSPKYYDYYGLSGFLFLTFIISTVIFSSLYRMDQRGQKLADDWNSQGRHR